MTRIPRFVSAQTLRWGLAGVVLLVGVVTFPRWWSPLRAWVTTTATHFRGAADAASDHDAHDHDHSGHDHAGHSDAESIELSPQALRNLGLTREYIRPVTRSTYRRTITVPAVIVERPGRTHLQVSAPMTSIVTRVYAVDGEAVRPGQLLFEMRLTHEDLVASQTEFLKTLGSLDIEQRELQRLQTLPEGAIAGKLLLDRQYEVQRLESKLAAEREALLLHGLNDEQVRRIEKDRKLLRSIQVFAPVPGDDEAEDFRLSQMFGQVTDSPSPNEPARSSPPATPRGPMGSDDLILEDLKVHQGQAVSAGETLCVLAEYSHLYIQGQAFERDVQSVVLARERGWPLTALFEGGTGETLVEGLQMAFVSNAIDVESRTLHFYVDLPNERLPVAHREGEPRFIAWKYRPGQRLKLLVPVEEWSGEFVVPVDAVAREGAESFIFLQNGNHFDRSPVHVKYRDQLHAVIANDGSVFEGDLIAWRGAHQLQMALKNKSGGGVDPHAGHNH